MANTLMIPATICKILTRKLAAKYETTNTKRINNKYSNRSVGKGDLPDYYDRSSDRPINYPTDGHYDS